MNMSTVSKTKDRRMKILRCPSLMYNYSGIPPFGLATIRALLDQKGFQIEQDDLDAKCAADELFPRNRWGKQFPAKDLMLDIERIRRFWGGEPDADVIDVITQVLSYTEIDDAEIVMLSCIEGDDPSAVLALCLGKYLRETLGKMVILGGEAFPHMMPVKSEVQYFYESGCYDYYIQGYGEVPLLELFEHFVETVRDGLGRIEAGDESSSLYTYCRGDYDFDNHQPIPYGDNVRADAHYIIRAWKALIYVFLTDHLFVLEGGE